MIDWKIVRALADWLHAANGSDPHQQAIQIMKIGEEVGEVFAARSRDETVAELCDVALTALVASIAWADDPETAFTQAAMPLDGITCKPPAVAIVMKGAFQAYIGYVGQNPRKGRTHTRDDVAASLCRVAHVALNALHGYTRDPVAEFGSHLSRTAARVNIGIEEWPDALAG